MNNTKGHVAAITDGRWHPREKKNFMTASLDGSIRVWDLESKVTGVDMQLMHSHLIKSFTTKGSKLPFSSCSYSRSGALIAGGCTDGSL